MNRIPLASALSMPVTQKGRAFTLRADHALTAAGWERDVQVAVDESGHIESVEASGSAQAHGQGQAQQCGVLLPAPANLHSHAFQRAFAGLAEQRGPDARDSFWTWRSLMYRYLEQLGPDDIQAISAFVGMESMQAGFASLAEFHYLHHQPDGTPYSNLAEMSQRVAAGAEEAGMGLSLLPVLYHQGGCDGRALTSAQLRFGNDIDRFARLHEGAVRAVAALGPDSLVGVAPHSLRAVSASSLAAVLSIAPDAPVHLHIAEQSAEVDELLAHTGLRPVQWLLQAHAVDARWCLIHATHMTPQEVTALAATGAVAGLCPITEANLGDGIFAGVDWLAAGGRFGVGSDSNVRISLAGELELLEYTQRLRDRGRALMASATQSSGRVLFESAARGGALATGRAAGVIAPGYLADLVALDGDSLALCGLKGDALIDAFVFAGGGSGNSLGDHGGGLVRDVWSAGRHMVRDGRHMHADAISLAYRKVISRLRSTL